MKVAFLFFFLFCLFDSTTYILVSCASIYIMIYVNIKLDQSKQLEIVNEIGIKELHD